MENEAQNQSSERTESPLSALFTGEPGFYTRYFKNLLNYSSVEEARESISKIDRFHCYFSLKGDHEGMLQTEILALTGKNRARWAGRPEVSDVFAKWLTTQLFEK